MHSEFLSTQVCTHARAIQAPTHAWLLMHMCIPTQTWADSPFQSQLWTLTENYSQSQVPAQSVPIGANLCSAEPLCWQVFPSIKTHARTHTHTNPHSLTQSSILTVQIVLVMGSSKLLCHHRCFGFYFQFGSRTHRDCFTWWLGLGLFQNIVLPTQKRTPRGNLCTFSVIYGLESQ